ncbi:hypothetical protein NXF25_006186 [Crotalus adamanteus]|uniref:CHHC U11-48K-type domain-containing protein n=1 Tax=Crotalus adamanteus TaxID=8729 RepID=A0AAW1C0Y7_CROAD
MSANLSLEVILAVHVKQATEAGYLVIANSLLRNKLENKNARSTTTQQPSHCKENNEKIAKKLATCPYNARHRIPKEELNSHLENCENKIPLDVSCGATSLNMGIKEVTGRQSPPSQEDWEADADKSPAPLFVFGKSYSEQKK